MKNKLILICLLLLSYISFSQSMIRSHHVDKTFSVRDGFFQEYHKCLKFDNPPTYIDGIDVVFEIKLNSKKDVISCTIVDDYGMPKKAQEVLAAFWCANEKAPRRFYPHCESYQEDGGWTSTYKFHPKFPIRTLKE